VPLNFEALGTICGSAAEVKTREAKQAAEKLTVLSFRGVLHAEESLFFWV